MFEDEDRGFGPLYMLQAMAPMMMIMVSVAVMFPLLLYVVVRWRDNRSPSPDPQLGLKFALHYFRLQSFQILLLGTTMLLFSMLGKDLGEGREFIYRPAFGFLVPAGVVFGITSVMLGKTNNYSHPIVARTFNGFNMMVTGLVGFVVFIMAFQILFQKGKSGNDGRMVWSAFLVYVTAWAALAAMFSRQVLESPAPPTVGGGGYGPGPVGGPPKPMQRPLA